MGVHSEKYGGKTMSLNTRGKHKGQDLEAEGHTVHVLCTASNQDQVASSYWKLFKEYNVYLKFYTFKYQPII